MILKPFDPTPGSTKVIEIKRKTSEHSLARKKKKYNFECKHDGLLIDEERGLVTCKACKKEMSCLQAMLLLCSRIWWEENTRERQIEYDLKRVTKVQAAALTCLYEAGVTPEKYAQRWQKEQAIRAAKEVQKQAEVPLVDATGSATPA